MMDLVYEARAELANARDIAARTARGARQTWTGVAGLSRETIGARHGASSPVVVGGISDLIPQAPGTILSIYRRLDTDIKSFGKELADLLEKHGYYTNPAAAAPALVGLHQLFADAYSPLEQNWERFFASHGDSWFGALWWDHTKEADQYRKQLVDLRASAAPLVAAMGDQILTPAPAVPEPGMIDKLVAAIWGLVRVLFYGGVAAAGIFTLTTAYRMIKEA